MSDKEKNVTEEQQLQEETAVEETSVEEAPAEDYKEKFEHEHDAHLRLAAEYDNFRKRSQKEKDASYTNG